MGTLTNPGVNTTTSPRTLPADSFDAASSGPRVLWTGSLDTHHTGFFGHPPHRSPTTQVARQLTLGAGEPHSAFVIPAKAGTNTTHGIPALDAADSLDTHHTAVFWSPTTQVARQLPPGAGSHTARLSFQQSRGPTPRTEYPRWATRHARARRRLINNAARSARVRNRRCVHRRI